MAATVSVKQCTGAGPATTSAGTSRLCTADNAAPGTSYPMVKPTTGTNRSYWQTYYLNADTTPAGTINNVKWYTDGAITWAGVYTYAGTTATYTQAVGTEGLTGSDSSVAVTLGSSYTSAAPLLVTGSIANPNTGKISDYVVVQADVTTESAAGQLADELITLKYDET